MKGEIVGKKFVANRNGNSCYLACLESFLDSVGKARTQEQMTHGNPDLCEVVKDKTGAIMKGVIPTGREGELCAREGISLEAMPSVATIDALRQIISAGGDFAIGVTQNGDQMHAVLVNSIDAAGNIWVMDPDQGARVLNTDYENITE